MSALTTYSVHYKCNGRTVGFQSQTFLYGFPLNRDSSSKSNIVNIREICRNLEMYVTYWHFNLFLKFKNDVKIIWYSTKQNINKVTRSFNSQMPALFGLFWGNFCLFSEFIMKQYWFAPAIQKNFCKIIAHPTSSWN